MIKIFECSICKELSKKIKGEERFRGTRHTVRKHSVEIHRTRNQVTFNKIDVSATTNNILSEEFK